MDSGWGSRFTTGALGAVLGIVGTMGGAATSGTSSGGPLPSAGLRPFASCEALRQWYVDRTISQVGAYGWGGRVYPMFRTAAPATGAVVDGESSTADSGVSSGTTGTNVQEAGVDEPDVAKTDGRIVVHLEQNRQIVVTDVTGVQPRELSSWRLPRMQYADDLLLVAGHVLVSGQGGGYGIPQESGRVMPGGFRQARTDLYDVDVTDPSHPTLVAHSSWSGTRLSMRQYGDTVRLVTSAGLPDLPFVQPRGGRLDEKQATARNRQVVRDSTIEDWLPSYAAQGRTTRALDCSQVFHPATADSATPGGTDTVGVYTMHPGDLATTSAVAVTGAGGDVYSSADRLYVWSSAWGGEPGWGGVEERALPRPMTTPRTTVHAFALDGDTTRYLASGTFAGTVRDRWSFDAHDGHLRVAVGWPHDNGILVLDEQGDRLAVVGQLRGLGRGEAVQSVRWFDDLAVLVTFRQMDPLYTVDVSDPTHPRALGALHLPGFSSYLHPIGGDHLLGLGTAATSRGESLGAKAAVFDIADPGNARELDSTGFGRDTWLAAADDPHAFTWVPTGEDSGTAITSLTRAGAMDERTTTTALDISSDGRISRRELPLVGGWQQRALPLGDGRVALVGDRVALVDVAPAG